VETLLIQRENHPDDLASGQVALPGGRTDSVDGTLRRTALRESLEEVGLTPEDFTKDPTFIEVREAPVFGLRVAVFAAWLADPKRSIHVADPREVAELFWLPRSKLSELTEVARSTASGEIRVEAVLHDGHVLWGFTLRVLRNFFAVAGPGDGLPPNREASAGSVSR
jgi:8-oxo-dGTP pyrophosphatase MutT (NUDIX family)